MAESFGAAPRERLAGAEASRRDAGRDTWPGLGLAAGTALLSGLAAWFWLLPALADGSLLGGATGASALAEVAPGDRPAALRTVDRGGFPVNDSTKRDRNCPRRLAWITLAQAPQVATAGEPVRVRVRSGGYFSPVFVLSPRPVRIAIPYPAPYQAGRGELTVFVEGGEAVVALTPPWHVPAAAGGAMRVVQWHPGAACADGAGE